MTKIAIGQYYPTKSLIHNLDPRIKLIFTILYIALLFIIDNVCGYLLFTIYISTVITISKVPPNFIFKSLKAIMMILIFTISLNILFTPGQHVLVEFSIFTITMEGLFIAIKMSVRLILLIIGSSVLTLTTSPIELTDAIEFILKPLKKIGVPAHEIAMMMTISLRFIPTLLEEMDKIMKAQIARGANFDTGGIFEKAKGLIPLLVPLFISSFRRADELAIAMESRCYRGDINRTKMKKMKFEKRDYIALCIFLGFVVLIILSRFI